MAAFRAREGLWRTVPVHAIFGSEERSARAGAIAARADEPAIVLGASAARQLGVATGDWVATPGESVVLGGRALPVIVDETMADGLVGLPSGRPPVPAQPGVTFEALTKTAAPRATGEDQA